MSDTFADALTARALHLITRTGARRVAILGFTPAALGVARNLRAAGLGPCVLGLFAEAPLHVHEIDLRALDELPALEPDLLIVGDDANKAELLLAYRERACERTPLPAVALAGTAHLQYRDSQFAEIDAPALVPSYATGSPNTKIHLFQCLKAAAANDLRGAIVEFGAFKGGTTAWLARAAQRLGLKDCPVIGLDSWTGFPARRSVLDLYEHPRCVFSDFDAVRAYTEPFGIELIAGDISETYGQLEGRPLLLCFFDTDNYSPTRLALELASRQLVPGGAIVFDHVATTAEYIDTLGERIAAFEVLEPAGFLHLHDTGVFVKLR